MNEKKHTVALEDLLQVKRAERPPVEFWAEFERELRVKQLAAIVAPRPWWAPLIRVGSRVSRYQVPAGAAAILALSFVTLNYYRTADSGANYAAGVALPVQSLSEPETALASMPVLATPAPSAEQIEDSGALDETLLAEGVTATTGRLAHTTQLLDEQPAPAEPSPSARAIAANLAAAQAAAPEMMDEIFGMAVTKVEIREQRRDPLAQVSSPSEFRRSRLLATALPVPVGYSDVEVGTSDRVARRLTEDRLYDTISRIGVRGDRVAIKF